MADPPANSDADLTPSTRTMRYAWLAGAFFWCLAEFWCLWSESQATTSAQTAHLRVRFLIVNIAAASWFVAVALWNLRFSDRKAHPTKAHINRVRTALLFAAAAVVMFGFLLLHHAAH